MNLIKIILYFFFIFSICSCSESETIPEIKPPEEETPTFPEVVENGNLNIMDCGIVADGHTDNTQLIQRAINECAAQKATLIFPEGTYYSRPLFIKSNTTIEFREGATLLGSSRKSDYDAAFPDAGAIETSALIYGKEVRNIVIRGKGTIDGQGGSADFQLGNGTGGRPKILHFIKCNNVTIDGISLKNSAFWTAHFLTCDTLKIKGVQVYGHSNWNNDGLDIDSKNVEISDCVIDCDDDGLCFKSDRGIPCENVVAKNCTIKSNCNAIKFGTASKSGFKNIQVSNCLVAKASEENFRHWKTSYSWAGITQDVTVIAGIAIESVDGGVLQDVSISDIEMNDVQTPIFIRLGDRQRAYSSNISVLKDVTIKDVNAVAASKIASSITGVPGGKVENVLLQNISIAIPGGGTEAEANASVPEVVSSYPENRMFGGTLPAAAFYVRHVNSIQFENINVHPTTRDERPDFVFDDVENYSVN